MSEEQNQEQNVKETKKKGCKAVAVISVISLLFSIAALTLSILTFVGHPLAASSSNEGGKVVISKQFDKGQSFEKAQKTQKPIIVFFYTDWCGFCQRFAPVFDKITKDSKIKKNFAIAYVNCENQENQALAQEYEVSGFPTVYVIDKEGKKTHLDNNTFFSDDTKEVVKNKALELIGEK